ncbi:MAG TPA: hypothetical protein VM533_14540 [Fimbriiglobus sp.]|jgi:hypothetical protein|nr:hypothetical protein [Fimbriiglobus sp.]
MKRSGQLLGLIAGVGLGAAAAVSLVRPEPAAAGSNDRIQDYVMATGAVSLNPRQQSDGVWLLDYRSGKLLGTVIDRNIGKIVGWAEVDLVAEFEVAPKQDVHFMMVTGWITAGQSALYVAETSTGKFGVYTMGPGTNGGVVIRRHDLTAFRRVEPPAPGPAAAPAVVPAPAVAPVPGAAAPPVAPPPGGPDG